MIVVDASVFIKLFVAEDDSEQAARFLSENKGALYAPSLLLHEILKNALHHEVPVSDIYRLLDATETKLMNQTQDVSERAFQIAKIGSKEQGRPTLEDSVYHALALELGATFLTADRRHYERTKHLGAVQLFSEMVAS